MQPVVELISHCFDPQHDPSVDYDSLVTLAATRLQPSS